MISPFIAFGNEDSLKIMFTFYILQISEMHPLNVYCKFDNFILCLFAERETQISNCNFVSHNIYIYINLYIVYNTNL